MFVIVQCLDNLRRNDKDKWAELSHEERIGMTLQRAGISITVTSATDVAVFAIGSFTVGLKQSTYKICVFGLDVPGLLIT